MSRKSILLALLLASAAVGAQELRSRIEREIARWKRVVELRKIERQQ